MKTIERKPVARLKADQNQPRKHFPEDDLRRLGESLKVRQLQPLLVKPDGTIIDGERRWRPAQLVGLESLDVIVCEAALRESEIRVIQLTSKLLRQGLTPQDFVPWRFAHRGRKIRAVTQKTLLRKGFAMNRIEQMVRFACPACDKRLKSLATNAGRRCRCPHCSTRMKVPGHSRALAVRPVVQPVPEPYPVVAPAQQEQATVPLKLALPKNLGGIETTVSQGTANSMAKVATGGFLVVLGIAAAAFFGFRKPSA
jgi:hypothetical protein